MPSKLNAITTGTPRLKFIAEADGGLEIQNNGNTAISIANTGGVNVVSSMIVTGNTSVSNVYMNATGTAIFNPSGLPSLTFNADRSLGVRSIVIDTINNTDNFSKLSVLGYGPNRGFGIVFRPSLNDGTPCWFLNTSGTQVGSINTSASATAYGTTSDYRLKNNIQPLTNGLDKVMLLKPSKWTWAVDNSEGEGFIAHELQEHIPNAVTGEKDKIDSEGNPIYQGVDTSFLVATLTKAIQELKQEIDLLKNKIETLENR
jgi:hypothetical protein